MEMTSITPTNAKMPISGYFRIPLTSPFGPKM